MEYADASIDTMPTHEEIVERYENDEIEIRVHRNSARFIYAGVADSLMIKVFHFLIQVYSFPLIILAGIVVPIIMAKYIYILYYFIGLGVLIWLESLMMILVVTNAVLENSELFWDLLERQVIRIQEK